jgi:hypothetical protein
MEEIDYNSDIDPYSDPEDLVIPSDPEEDQISGYNPSSFRNAKLSAKEGYNPPSGRNPQFSNEPGQFDYDEDFEDSAEKFESEEFDFPLPLSSKQTGYNSQNLKKASLDSIGYKITDSTRPQSLTSRLDGDEGFFMTETETKRSEPQKLDTPGTTTGVITTSMQRAGDFKLEEYSGIQTTQDLESDRRFTMFSSIQPLETSSKMLSNNQRKSNSYKQEIQVITDEQKNLHIATNSSKILINSPSKQIQVLQELQNENTDLRRELKKLSDQLNEILDSNSNLYTETRKRPPSSPSTKQRLKGEQLKTAEKQLEAHKIEKEKLQRRIEKIQSVDYVTDLKKSIQEKEQHVAKLEKLIKMQDLKHKKAGKDLERYYAEDERPEELKKISDITAEIGRYKEKCAEIETELDRMQEVYDNQYQMESELTEKHEKLMDIATHYNTPLNTQNKVQREQDRIKEQLEKMRKQMGVKQRSYDTSMARLKQKELELKQQLTSNAKTKAYVEEQIVKVNGEVTFSLIEVEKAIKECENNGLGRLVPKLRGRSQGNDASFLTEDRSMVKLRQGSADRRRKLESASLSDIKSLKETKQPIVNNPFKMDLRTLNTDKESEIQSTNTPALIPSQIPVVVPIAPIAPIPTSLSNSAEVKISARSEPIKDTPVMKPKFDFKLAMNSPSKPDLMQDKNSIITPIDADLPKASKTEVTLSSIKSDILQADVSGQLYTPSVPVVPSHTPSFKVRGMSNKNTIVESNDPPSIQNQSKDKKETIETPKVNPLDFLHDMKTKEKVTEPIIPSGVSIAPIIPTIPTVSRRDRGHLLNTEDSKSPPPSHSPAPSSFLEDIKKAQNMPKEDPKLDNISSRVTRDRSHLFKQESNTALPKPEETKPFVVNKIPDPFENMTRNKPVFENKAPDTLPNSSSKKSVYDSIPSTNDLAINKPLFDSKAMVNDVPISNPVFINKIPDPFDTSRSKPIFDNKIPDPFENLGRSKNPEISSKVMFNPPNPIQSSLFESKPDLKDSIKRDRSHLLTKEEPKPTWQQPTIEPKPAPILSSNRRRDPIVNVIFTQSYSLAEKAEKNHFLMDLEESSSPAFDPNEFKSQLLPTKPADLSRRPAEIAPKPAMSDFSPQPVSSKTLNLAKPAKPASKLYEDPLDLEEEIII